MRWQGVNYSELKVLGNCLPPGREDVHGFSTEGHTELHRSYSCFSSQQDRCLSFWGNVLLAVIFKKKKTSLLMLYSRYCSVLPANKTAHHTVWHLHSCLYYQHFLILTNIETFSSLITCQSNNDRITMTAGSSLHRAEEMVSFLTSYFSIFSWFFLLL